LLFAIWGIPGVGHPVLGGLGLAAAIGYCGVLGPRLHGDSLSDLGLPRPRENAKWLRGLAQAPGIEGAAVAAFIAMTACSVWIGWPNLLARLGLRRALPDLYAWAVGGIPGHALPLALSFPISVALLLFAIRRDCLAKAARRLAPVAAALACAIVSIGIARGLGCG
jgi:heme A synthase